MSSINCDRFFVFLDLPRGDLLQQHIPEERFEIVKAGDIPSPGPLVRLRVLQILFREILEPDLAVLFELVLPSQYIGPGRCQHVLGVLSVRAYCFPDPAAVAVIIDVIDVFNLVDAHNYPQIIFSSENISSIVSSNLGSDFIVIFLNLALLIFLSI